MLIEEEESSLFKTSESGFILRKIEENEDNVKNKDHGTTSLHYQLVRFLAKKHLDDYIEYLNAGLSVLFTAFYAIFTYRQDIP